MAEENGVDVSSQIKELEERAKQVGARMPVRWRALVLPGAAERQRQPKPQLARMQLPPAPEGGPQHAAAAAAAQLAPKSPF